MSSDDYPAGMMDADQAQKVQTIVSITSVSAAEAAAALVQYTALDPASGLFETANLRSRLGETAVALQLYRDYLAQFPDGADAPLAAWRAAGLAEDLGDVATAVSLYTLLGTNYPSFDDASEALFQLLTKLQVESLRKARPLMSGYQLWLLTDYCEANASVNLRVPSR